MDYDALECELVGVLNAYFEANQLTSSPVVLFDTVFCARQMPESPEELLQPYEKSIVNVQYADSNYSDPEATDMICQTENVRVVIYLQCNKMKGASGGYKLLSCVKSALVGYRAANSLTRMWISGYGDWRIEEGQMNPYIEFTFRTPSEQVLNDTSFFYPIDSGNSVNVSAPFVKVDSSLYELPNTTDVIEADNESLTPNT